jgi:hypothetical protein
VDVYVWSAVRPQGKSRGREEKSAQMYSAFGGARAPARMSCVSVLINRSVVVNQFVQQVLRHALVSVLPPLLFPCRPR